MNTFLIILLVAAGVLLLWSLLMLWRNQIVMTVRLRANEICYQKGDRTEYDNAKSYDAMMLDFRKWVFEDFYPQLAEDN